MMAWNQIFPNIPQDSILQNSSLCFPCCPFMLIPQIWVVGVFLFIPVWSSEFVSITIVISFVLFGFALLTCVSLLDFKLLNGILQLIVKWPEGRGNAWLVTYGSINLYWLAEKPALYHVLWTMQNFTGLSSWKILYNFEFTLNWQWLSLVFAEINRQILKY